MIENAGALSDRRQRISAYLALIRFDRPIGWLLLLWPTWIALFLAARGLPPSRQWLIFTAGVFLTRSAGCIVNDYADRWLDPHVERTRLRPLGTGLVSEREARRLFILIMLAAFALVCLTTWQTVLWAVSALCIMVLYPYSKRTFPMPQLVLGIAFGFGIPMAFSALGREPNLIVAVLFLTNLLWTIGYDTLYAMVDRDDDRRIGARSSALLFGAHDLKALWLMHAGTVALMWLLGNLAELKLPYDLAVLGFAAGGAYLIFSARARDRASCFRAFRLQHWLGMLWFLGVALSLLGAR